MERDATPQRPTLTSLLAHRARRRRAEAEAVCSDTYTDTERRLLEEAGHMTLIAHLEEVRRRLLWCIAAVLVGTACAYLYSEDILGFLTAPAGTLYFMKPTEAFFTYIKVSVYVGVLGASPLLLYHLWAFLIPALTHGEKQASRLVVPVAIVLFWTGILFSYFLVLPAALQFFIGFTTEHLAPMISVGQYLDFLAAFLLPFGVVFELPLALIVAAKLGFISSEFLRKQRKYFILLAFIIGGVVSPTPDIFSQSMIAVPMLLLYEFSYYVTRYVLHR